MSRTRTLTRCAAATAAAVLLPLLLVAPAKAAPAPEPTSGDPVHVFTSTESVAPGEVVGLQGVGFSATPTVTLAVVGSNQKRIKFRQSLPLLARSDRAVHAVVPPETPVGLYAVQVNGQATTWINRARGASLEFSEVSPGYPFRIFGRNLVLAGATPAVRFYDPTTGTSLPATVDAVASDEHELHVVAPLAIAPGTTYQLFVTNGHGGEYGESRVERDIEARTGGTGAAHDPFGIRTPWAADFVEIAKNVYDVTSDPRLLRKAAGDGATDDTLALQLAIDAASAAGGGTVLLPAGTYRVTEGAAGQVATALTMRSNVVLKGAGDQISVIRAQGVTSAGQTVKVPGGTHRAGFADLALHATGMTANSYNLNEQGYDVRQLFIVRNTWTNDQRGNLRWVGSFASGIGTTERGCSQAPESCWRYLAVRDSDFHATGTGGTGLVSNFYFVNWRDAVISGNTTSHKGGRLFINDNLDITVEDNEVIYAKDDGQKSDGGYGGFWADYTDRSQFLRNRITSPKTFPFSNDGEALAWEGYSHDSQGGHFGAVRSADATTVTIPVQKSPAAFTAPDGFARWTFASIDGAGAGQFRRVVGSRYDSSTGSYVLTLDQPFDIVPAPGSSFALKLAGYDFMAKDNYFENVPRPIWIYNSSHRDLAVVGNEVVNGESIQIRTDYRHNNNGDGFHVMQSPYIAGNTVIRDARETRGLGCYIAVRTALVAPANQSIGTHIYLPELRDNTTRCTRPGADTIGVTDPPATKNDGFWVYAQDRTTSNLDAPYKAGQPTAILGAIADGNTAASVDNAYSTGTGVEGLSIWRSTHTEDVGAFLRDDVGAGASQGSLGTYGPDGTPLSSAPPTGPGGGGSADPVYTASTTEDPQYTTPAMAFDGDRTTQWQAKVGDPERWVQAAYPSERTFDTVTITSYVSEGAAAQRIEAGRVLVEDASGELVEVATFAGNRDQDLVLKLAQPVSTKRLRLEVDSYYVAGYSDYPAAVVTEVTPTDSRVAPTA